MGRNLGQGRGGLAPEQQTGVGFKIERGKVHTGKGAIIGQFLVDGEQVPGEVTTDLQDLVAPFQRDASDLINRDRIPRQYHKAIKDYFSNVARELKDPGAKDAKKEPKAGADANQTAPGKDKEASGEGRAASGEGEKPAGGD